MNEAKQIYIEYLLLCVRLEDWHGVSDAANDLRVLEAKQQKRTPAQGGGQGSTDGDR